jgi:hypothetical protein
MPYPRLELAKSKQPRLADLYDHMWVYALDRYRKGYEFVVPKLVAPVLGISNGEAFVLLEQLAASGLFKTTYRVYCRSEGNLLATVDSLEALDQVQLNHCDFCDRDHGQDELIVQTEFKINAHDIEAQLAA